MLKINLRKITLLLYGCMSHNLNLLGENVTQVVKHVIEIQKYFQNHHRPAAWLKEAENSCKSQLPGETR
ncbi:hypothetical protein PR048_005195 [Dryococelus australis]|uniref:Uncharacterized protein n=1 Tax=Dryococelus australis TaxID=614101 RepID=A0ABQ9I8K7_9NEOP|nr:hypothetical protein PR048_005195 [Dryococelus australis]